MKACALSGKTSMSGKNIRNQHSIGWKYRAPKTNRRFDVNLVSVSVPDGKGGKTRIKVAARMLSSEKFLAVLSGQLSLEKARVAPKKAPKR